MTDDQSPTGQAGDEPTADRHLVTCQDCPDLVWTEALPDDASAGDPHMIEVLREAKRGAFRKIEGWSWTRLPPPRS